MFERVIAGGTVVGPAGTVRADVGIDDGRIIAIGLDLTGDQVIDARDCLVIPGAVDPHVHLQMQLAGRVSSDDFHAGTLAAACGGTTTVIDFTDPQPDESLAASLARRRQEADGQVFIDYGLHMTIPTAQAADPERMAEIPAVIEAGCASFKAYQAYSGMMLDDVALLRVMQAIGRTGGGLVLHSETGPVLDLLREQALAAGHTSPIWHANTRPAQLEATAIARAAELAHLANCPLHIFHVGCADGLGAVRDAAARGVNISAETCPQYLFLNAETNLGGGNGARYICSPPLRSASDQAALWDALGRGDCALVSTDHCPWTLAEKSQSTFAEVPGGVPSIEARLALVYSGGVTTGRLSLSQWVDVCCTQPAQRMGLAKKGRIAPGYDADIVIFDPTRRKQISVETLHETAGWTPYDGMIVDGWPRTVLLRGQTIVENELPQSTPLGRFVARRWNG